MINFVSFLWRQPGYHTQYTDAHVRRWHGMLCRHYRGEFTATVVTNEPGDYGAVRVVPLWDDWSDVKNPHGDRFPSCFRRLKIWSREAGEIFGERIVLMDLDCAIVGDITALFDRHEPIVLWRDPSYPRQPYNGGLVMLTAGVRPDVWDDFQGESSANHGGEFLGSDQAWIARKLGAGQAVWDSRDGVVSWKRHLQKGLPRKTDKIVMFHGVDKPWDISVQKAYRCG